MPIKELAVKPMDKWTAVAIANDNGGYSILYFRHVVGDLSHPRHIGHDGSAQFTAMAQYEDKQWTLEILPIDEAKLQMSGKVRSPYLPVSRGTEVALKKLWDTESGPLLFQADHPTEVKQSQVTHVQIEKMANKIAYRFDDYYEKKFKAVKKAGRKLSRDEIEKLLMDILSKRYAEEGFPKDTGIKDKVIERALVLVTKRDMLLK